MTQVQIEKQVGDRFLVERTFTADSAVLAAIECEAGHILLLQTTHKVGTGIELRAEPLGPVPHYIVKITATEDK